MKSRRRSIVLLAALNIFLIVRPAAAARAEAVQVATFDVDATPPVGFVMAYDPVKRVDELTLRCRGIVLLSNEKPIVLCAVDWIGIGNGGNDAFREALANAAGTTPDRVAVHTLHQHDAPGCDFEAEQILRDLGVKDLGRYEGAFPRQVLQRASDAVKKSLATAQPATHYGWGVGEVQKVASNRRILGDDGKVSATRYTATKNPALRAAPEGAIDPNLNLLSFWNKDQPIAALSYYACHPQSYYRTGIPSPDFPGIARFIRGQAVPTALHVHFNGAGGNIGAGKYNDGSKPNRMVLANRVADGMKRAWESTKKHPLAVDDLGWQTVPARLPVAEHLNEKELLESLTADDAGKVAVGAARKLSWLRRCQAGHAIDISCLRVGTARILHMPGELFVEYQLAAKAMRPDLNVAMAAYGDYGPGYIGTEVAYSEGGYEASPRASSVAPGVERVLTDAVRKLLKPADAADASTVNPLVRVVDLSIGESTTVELCSGEKVDVKLVDLQETRDPIRQAVRSAMVTVQVDGENIILESGMYNLPQQVAGVQIDCSVTKGYNSNGTPTFWGLDKDARLRLWPKDSPLMKPGALMYPVDQRWFATRTWFDNEPVDGGTKVLPKIYYHSGMDIGGTEELVKVIAATDAVVVSAGDDVLPEYLLEGGGKSRYGEGKTPVAPRADVVYLRDERGWYYRYSHLHKINDTIKPGRTIDQGTEIGLLGKKGSSGGWSHLHFEIKSRQPSGKWGTQAGYAFLWEAYRRQYQPKLVANARRKSFLIAGNDAVLDGSASWSATDSIQKYEWTFSDGTTATGPRVTRTFSKPGVFSEILKVTDEAGNVDYDFAYVHVLDPQKPDEYVPRIHAAYWPTFDNKVNQPITFKVRSFQNQHGNEVWDFGDGSPAVAVKSDGNAVQQAADGYAITQHTYEKPGDYIVSVQRSRKDGVTATTRLHVRVEKE
ncbi:PKD domain-containing protein [Fuerstiella marisgermanici]|uniref:PKD domain protein n=1 Tax=Fuerstiella marisgermanici TaxID=1891926 RepID=A0A1P8WNT3_9PLAN|nr:PKD domain-containing protein [Fuerstiella marisgermanici]APZ95717.1 PKD domain protein [Fuerstiella marisgermanici]